MVLEQFCIFTVTVVCQPYTHRGRRPHCTNASGLVGYCTTVMSNVTSWVIWGKVHGDLSLPFLQFPVTLKLYKNSFNKEI